MDDKRDPHKMENHQRFDDGVKNKLGDSVSLNRDSEEWVSFPPPEDLFESDEDLEVDNENTDNDRMNAEDFTEDAWDKYLSSQVLLPRDS